MQQGGDLYDRADSTDTNATVVLEGQNVFTQSRKQFDTGSFTIRPE